MAPRSSFTATEWSSPQQSSLLFQSQTSFFPSFYLMSSPPAPLFIWSSDQSYLLCVFLISWELITSQPDTACSQRALSSHRSDGGLFSVLNGTKRYFFVSCGGKAAQWSKHCKHIVSLGERHKCIYLRKLPTVDFWGLKWKSLLAWNSYLQTGFTSWQFTYHVFKAATIISKGRISQQNG